jgi:hypothetical protein
MAVREQPDRLSLTVAVSLMASLVLAASSCADPVVDEPIEALGPEAAKVPPGPLHRPGQPCVLCHSEEGNAEPTFTLGGTVYLDAMSNTPVGNVDVEILDVKGNFFTTTTNCAGNFYVRPDEFTPAFPIWLGLRAGMVYRSMDTASYREGSCATCHYEPRGASSAGHVYLVDDPTTEMPPPSGCQ